LTSYGTFDLPFGANGFLFRNSTGAMKKAIEGWQLSWVASMTSGVPMSISDSNFYGFNPNNTLWNNSRPNLVGSFNTKAGKVTYAKTVLANGTTQNFGYYFGKGRYAYITDPVCSDSTKVQQVPAGSPGLSTTCAGGNGLKAVIDTANNNQVIFRNADPGTKGNFVQNSLTGPGRWSLDMAMSKAIEFMEGKKIDFRIDAQNIFNHATPSQSATAWNARFTQLYNPSGNLNDNGTPFGYLNTKGGHRTFQAKIRISF
jgi:hypothetical protein